MNTPDHLTITDTDADDFDNSFVHYFDIAPRQIVERGDTALCGVIAKTTRNASNEDRQSPRCPICTALLNDKQ